MFHLSVDGLLVSKKSKLISSKDILQGLIDRFKQLTCELYFATLHRHIPKLKNSWYLNITCAIEAVKVPVLVRLRINVRWKIMPVCAPPFYILNGNNVSIAVPTRDLFSVNKVPSLKLCKICLSTQEINYLTTEITTKIN